MESAVAVQLNGALVLIYDTLAVEQGHRPAEEPHRGRALLVGQHLDVRQAGGVIHGHVDVFVTSSWGAALARIAGDPMADTLEPGQLLDVDMDHVAGLLPLLPLHLWFGIEVPQSVQPQAPHRPSHGADRAHQQPDDPP